MKKTTTKMLIISALVPVALVSTKGEPLSTSKTGLYIGAALGGADLTAKSNLLLNRLIIVNPTPQKFSLTTTDKNIAADIFVGYGKRLNCLSLEGEITGSFASLSSKTGLNITNINTTQSLEIKTTSAVGGAFKLGYYINPTNKLYLKIGFELRRFKANFTDPSNFLLNLNKTYNSTAFVPGLGLEIDLTPCLALRTEYRVALHPKKTVQISNAASQATAIQTKPTIHHLNLGLVFKI